MTIEFRILGPLEVAVDGGLVTLPARQQRVLLSALLIDAGQVVSTDRLIDALWGETPPPTAKAALHNVVAELRRLLSPGGEPLTTRPPGYVVTVEGGRFDLREFETALEQGRSALADGEYTVASQRTRDALALWRGEPLADVTYEAFAAPAIARLEEMRIVAMESRHRGRSRAGTARRADRRAARAGGRVTDARGGARTADAGALPVRPPAGSAGRVSRVARASCRRAGARPESSVAAVGRRDPSP